MSPPAGDLLRAAGADAESPHGGQADFVLVHGAVDVPGAGDPVDYTLSIPAVMRSPSLHAIVPGFGGIKRSSRGLRNALAGQEGVASLSFEPAREGGMLRDLFKAQQVHVDTLAAIFDDLPNNPRLADTPNAEQLDLSRTVLLPHSMGGLPATERARLYPDETQAVIYMGSVGLEASVMIDYVRRVAMSASHEVAGKYAQGKLVPGANRLHLAYRTARYYLSNPLRTLGEIGSCLAADIEQPLRALGILGVETGALYFGADRLVPSHDSALEAARAVIRHCEIMEGYGHLAPQRHPFEVAARLGNISARLEEASLAA